MWQRVSGRIGGSLPGALAAMALALAAPGSASGSVAMGTTLPCVAGTSCSGVVAQIDPQGAFIAGAMQDLLGRVPSPSDETYWRAFLGGGDTREQMAGTIAASPEYRVRLINSLYEKLLHRSADPADQSYWLGLLGAGATDEEMIAGIVGSAEYYTLAGGTNPGFVSQAYSDLLGRAASSSDVSFWDLQLENGVTREQMATSVATGPEYRVKLVDDLYLRLLHRAADPASQSYWLNRLQAGATDEQLIATLVGSQEYFVRDPHWAATIAWGDQTSSSGTVGENLVSASHTYAQGGSFPITVRLTDDRGVSVSVAATADVSPVAASAVNTFSFGKTMINSARGTAVLPVVLPGPGTLRFGGRQVNVRVLSTARASSFSQTSVAAAGTVRLLVRAAGRTKRRLDRDGAATIRVSVAFTPSGGTAHRETRVVRLRRAGRP